MARPQRLRLISAACVATALLTAAASYAAIFPLSSEPKEKSIEAEPPSTAKQTTETTPLNGSVPAGLLLRVPVTRIIPGNRPIAPDIKNPLADDPQAAKRGMQHFDTFNCSGCHAASGGGGMGPALSNEIWLYGSSPANIYLTIVQGRSKGMPAFGTMLPDQVIWELVSYVQSIAEPPSGRFGTRISADPQSPEREQVPATKVASETPWRYTQPFHNGQRPN